MDMDCDSSISASQVSGITSVHHHTLECCILIVSWVPMDFSKEINKWQRTLKWKMPFKEITNILECLDPESLDEFLSCVKQTL
jgi:hypothetical protein